jgi:signal transduction histidine kinase/ActR/RegA family two-component response regulator
MNEIISLNRALEGERDKRLLLEKELAESKKELKLSRKELQLLGSVADERLEASSAVLRRHKIFYESILNNVPAEIFVADSSFKFLYLNPKVEESEEVRDYLIGRNDFDFCRIKKKPQGIAENRRKMFLQVQQTRALCEWVEEAEEDVEKRYFLRRLLPLFGENEKIELYIGYSLEITESVQYREELIGARDIAQKATLAKSEFLSKMSHEIRTPLNAIIGITNILFQEEKNAEQENYLQAMKFSADTLLGIINEVLDFSKIEAGKLTFEKIPFNLNHLLRGIERTFSFKLKGHGINFKIKTEDGMPPFLVGDRVKLNQIFLNLVGNAVKFTKEGEILIEANIDSQSDDSIEITFAVSDTGLGIAADKLESIFESFTQEDENTTGNYGGTGLGLTITRKFIEAQGGKIWLESKPGEGSTFYFKLSFGFEFAPRIESDNSQWSRSFDTISSKKLLVAEDNLMNQMVLRKMLERWDPSIIFVENGQEALAALEADTFDLVFFDVQMPIMDGIAAVEKWRQIEIETERKVTPIIALTADAFKESRDRVIKSGMNDFLSKPIELSELRRVLAKFLLD